jgi:hypothetical protein
MLDPHSNRRPNTEIGDPLSIPKDTSTTRINFQNINGASVAAGGTWPIVYSHWKHMSVDIALACEHKLDTTQPYVMKRLHDGARTEFGLQNYTLSATSSPSEAAGAYKPGGVLAMVIGRTKSKLLTTGHDELGRWTYIKFNRKAGLPLTIISTYQVVDVDPRNVGGTTYANQLLGAYTTMWKPNPEWCQTNPTHFSTCHYF